MKYLNKIHTEQQGTETTDSLLTRGWDNETNEYQGVDYDGLLRHHRNTIKTLLLDESNNLCCYCMRNISQHTISIEHIIPQKPNAQFDVQNYYTARELKENIVLRNDFDFKSNIIPPSHYPHDIGYHNLIASCKSKSHCNGFRGNENMKPFIFDSGIEQKTGYDRTGRIDCEQYEDDFAVLGISTDKLLQLIRRIWAELSDKIKDPATITSDEIELLILEEMLDDPDYVKIIDIFFSEPSKKDTLLEYTWFFDYYK